MTHEPDAAEGNEAATAVERHAPFILDAYLAAFDRVASADEIAGCAARIEAGQSPAAFLSSLMRSEERRLVDQRRLDMERRGSAMRDDNERFIAESYRVLFNREADAAGLATHRALLDEGVPRADVLHQLSVSEEAMLLRASPAASANLPIDIEELVRTIFEAVLHRPPEANAVEFFAQELRDKPDIAAFTRNLAGSPEGRALRGQQHSKTLNTGCANLAMFLEAMLRQRGLAFDHGPIAASDMPVAKAERLLTRLVHVIEMLALEPRAS